MPSESTSRSKKPQSKRNARTGRPDGAAHTNGRATVTAPKRDKSPAVSEEMWALVYDVNKDKWDKTKGFRKERVAKPVLDETADPLDASSVILKVLYTGFCGSDAGIWFRSSFKKMIHDSLKAEGRTTRVIGHELLGVIEEAGSVAGARYGVHKGDICAAESHIVCGKCHQCLVGKTHVCVDERIIGISRDGCFAEYIKLPARVLWKTDVKKIRREVAAVQEPFGNAVHASTAVDLRGKTIAIFGTGAIGCFTILIARALGAARIIGVEPDPINAAMARQLGADEVVEFKPNKSARNSWKSNPQVVQRVIELSRGDGVDVAMEMAGYNSSVNNAYKSVRRGGEIVLFGIRSGDFKIEDFQHNIVKGVTVKNVIGRRIFETWEITRNLMETRENKIQEKVWEIILNKGKGTIMDIKDFKAPAFEKMIQSHAKVLIKWT